MSREELIAYDKWLTENKWGSSEIVTPEQAADRYLTEHPLPPAEGAEKVQRCPVCMGKGLVPNSFYATTSGIGSTTQTYLPEKCRTCNGAGVIILPYPKLQPTAEGAEEMLWSGAEKIAEKYDITDRIDDDPETGELQFIPSPSFIEAVHDLGVRFATLHAQRLAEKMVEEQLPSNKQIHEAALAWAKEHSEAPDKDCPDWLIRDYEAGAYFVRQCMGCWNKTDEMHDNRLLRFIKWLRYRNFTDDTMTDEGWLNLYHNNPDIPE